MNMKCNICGVDLTNASKVLGEEMICQATHKSAHRAIVMVAIMRYLLSRNESGDTEAGKLIEDYERIDYAFNC